MRRTGGKDDSPHLTIAEARRTAGFLPYQKEEKKFQIEYMFA
jgi:hypothetical protein